MNIEKDKKETTVAKSNTPTRRPPKGERRRYGRRLSPSQAISFDLLQNMDQLKLRESVTRAGVIPYTTSGDNIYYCVGVDKKSRDYTDFGGGFSRKRDGDPLEAAARELREESLGVFTASVDRLRKSWAVHNGEMLIIFCRYDLTHVCNSVETFQQRVEKETDPEVDSIVWFHESEFYEKIRGTSFYFKVSDSLRPRIYSIDVSLHGGLKSSNVREGSGRSVNSV